MKTLFTTVLIFVTLAVFGQIRPDLQPADYSPELTDEVYGLQDGSIVRYLFSSLDSLFSAGTLNEITYVSDTSGISSPQLGDVAINSTNDTLMIHGTYGWLVFVGGSGGGGGGGSMDDWNLQADSGSPATISDGENVTISGGGIASTAISGNTVTVTATEVDGSTSNELDTITVAGDSGSVEISDGETLTVAGSGIASTAVSGNTVTVTATEVDGSTSNEIQTVDSLIYSSGTITLALENDGEAPYTVDISGVNTDAQTLSLSGDSLAISGGNTVVFSPSGISSTADGTDTLDLSSYTEFELSLNSVTEDSLTFSSPTQWETYTLHLTNVSTDTVTFPSNLIAITGDTLGSRILTSDKLFSFRYNGTNHYCYDTLGVEYVETSIPVQAEYQVLLDTATARGYSLPSASQQTAQNQLVYDLKAASVWTEMDVLYVFATDADSLFAGLNWVNPGTSTCSYTGTLTWTADQGFETDGSTGYINTNYNPRNGSITKTDAGLGYWSYLQDTTFRAMTNQDTLAVSPTLSAQYISGEAGFRIMYSNNSNYTSTGHNFYQAHRTSSTDVVVYNSATSVGTDTQDNSAAGYVIPNYNMYIGARNNDGTADVFLQSWPSIFFVSSNLNSSASDIYDAFNTYMSGL